MRMLSLNGIKAVEVEEDELGMPVTASYHVRVPPRHNAVFEVNIHAELQGTQLITGNRHLLEKHPNMYQHEIAIKSERNNETFPLMAITNLDQVKTLHLHKGEVVGFARPESTEVTYIATTDELNIEETIDVIPRNWIPQQKWNLKGQALNQAQPTFSEGSKSSQKSLRNSEESKLLVQEGRENHKKPTDRKLIREFTEHSQDSRQENAANKFHISQRDNACSTMESKVTEHSQNLLDQQWCDISEVVDSDFLISPGKIYLNRRVQLEDTDIKETTKENFGLLCEQQHKAFSENNKDIGRTQLIEMEIDTRDSLPVVQLPYTLPLKHYDWVRQEIETLEKSGVIERSLSRWASPVIVVLKKSATDKPPHRRLCVDYRKVNALQPEVKHMDKSTGCLSLYPLPKIDEMFSKWVVQKCFPQSIYVQDTTILVSHVNPEPNQHLWYPWANGNLNADLSDSVKLQLILSY